MTEEEKVKAEKEALGKVKSLVDEGVKGVKAELELKYSKEIEDLKKANKDTQEHADQLDMKLQKGQTEAAEPELVKAIKGLDLAKLKTGEGGFQEVTVKAAVSMMPGTVNPAANPLSGFIGNTEIVSGLGSAPQGDMNIMRDADTAGTNAANIVWINKYNEDGNAAFIAPGVLKPLRSFAVRAENSTAKKVAVRFNVATETLEDYDFMAAEINKDGIQEVKRKTNEALLNSAGTADEPKGITKYASAFTLTSVKGEDPDNYGALRAASAQVRSLKFNPDRAYINPIDAANMDLKKGANGQYVLAPFTTADGRRIGAIQIVETDEIPVGSFLVGDMKKFHVRPYKGIQVKVGYNGEDFSKNMVTIIVEQRLHAYVNSIDTGAFVYDTFATVKAAILKPAV